MPDSVKCPHCSTIVFIDFFLQSLLMNPAQASKHNAGTGRFPNCHVYVIYLWERKKNQSVNPKLIYPKFPLRGVDTKEVPAAIVQDYNEAVSVIGISPKASAALARRCLQNMLIERGYAGRDLSKQVLAIINEPDPSKALSESLRTTIDGVRNFGNFSAHPLTDITSLQIVDVEPQEAEWCLDILEECFDHFYTKPALAKARKSALNAKLKSLGKPPAH